MDRRQFLAGATASAVSVKAAAAQAPSDQRPASVAAESRSSEVRALRAFAEKTHPRGLEAAANAQWRAGWEALERSADHLPDGPYFVGMRKALAWFEDGHSTVFPLEFLPQIPDPLARGPFGLSLPWKVRLFDDGARVVATTADRRAMLGAKVEQIGSLPAPELIKAFDSTWAGNRAWAHSWAATAFGSPAQLNGLGAIGDPEKPVSVRLSGHGGQPLLTLNPRRGPETLGADFSRPRSEREKWAEAIGRGNYVKNLPDRKAVFISIDDMTDVEGASFEQLTKEAFEAAGSTEVERLVIDLRRNGGGDNFLGEALRKHIERSRFNRPGGLYVLIGPATFSAAQNLANRLERETFALFVGGPTGLSPNHYGDAKLFTGSVTGLVAAVSELAWFDSYPQDKRPWIMPDLPVAATFDDWSAGRDPALELALSHQSSKPSEDWSLDRVFYYKRASQDAEWTPFWA